MSKPEEPPPQTWVVRHSLFCMVVNSSTQPSCIQILPGIWQLRSINPEQLASNPKAAGNNYPRHSFHLHFTIAAETDSRTSNPNNSLRGFYAKLLPQCPSTVRPSSNVVRQPDRPQESTMNMQQALRHIKRDLGFGPGQSCISNLPRHRPALKHCDPGLVDCTVE